MSGLFRNAPDCIRHASDRSALRTRILSYCSYLLPGPYARFSAARRDPAGA
jgi:hypothetical protein